MHIEIYNVCQISIFMGQPRWRRSLRRDDKLESNDRSASSLGFESGRSRLCKLHSRSCISKVEKEILSLTTPASGMKAIAHIGAWHNSLDRMAAVILVSPLLNYLLITSSDGLESYLAKHYIQNHVKNVLSIQFRSYNK